MSANSLISIQLEGDTFSFRDSIKKSAWSDFNSGTSTWSLHGPIMPVLADLDILLKDLYLSLPKADWQLPLPFKMGKIQGAFSFNPRSAKEISAFVPTKGSCVRSLAKFTVALSPSELPPTSLNAIPIISAKPTFDEIIHRNLAVITEYKKLALKPPTSTLNPAQVHSAPVEVAKPLDLNSWITFSASQNFDTSPIEVSAFLDVCGYLSVLDLDILDIKSVAAYSMRVPLSSVTVSKASLRAKSTMTERVYELPHSIQKSYLVKAMSWTQKNP
jgi:hypothetical protein